jgi:hypothetical protein
MAIPSYRRRFLMKPIKLAKMDCKQVSREIGDFVIGAVLEIRSTGLKLVLNAIIKKERKSSSWSAISCPQVSAT